MSVRRTKSVRNITNEALHRLFTPVSMIGERLLPRRNPNTLIAFPAYSILQLCLA